METLKLTNAPVFDEIVVSFDPPELIELTIMDRVTGALERAGEYHAAGTFLHAARLCDTDEELLGLAAGYVVLDLPGGRVPLDQT